tara:strand:+ start:1482 stop:1700 length:219 start_codon:yes stop_codon:yes gene_type:complete
VISFLKWIKGDPDQEIADLRNELEKAKERRADAEKEQNKTIIGIRSDPTLRAIAGAAGFVQRRPLDRRKSKR